MLSEVAGEMSFTEVTSMLERRQRQLEQALQETDIGFVSSRASPGLKRFSSTPLLGRRLSNDNLPTSVTLQPPPPGADGTSPSGPPSSRRIPIVGYELMEERARFTVYKLKIKNENFVECWFVFRRYTDFVRLHSKLKTEFGALKLKLPRKRWFGDNFDSRFIDDRVRGLQQFIDQVTADDRLVASPAVRQFFCLDHPPSYLEASEENRAIFEALEETIDDLRRRLVEKELECESLRSLLAAQQLASNADVRRRVMKGDNCGGCLAAASAGEMRWPPPSRDERRSSDPHHFFTSSPISAAQPTQRLRSDKDDDT